MKLKYAIVTQTVTTVYAFPDNEHMVHDQEVAMIKARMATESPIGRVKQTTGEPDIIITAHKPTDT